MPLTAYLPEPPAAPAAVSPAERWCRASGIAATALILAAGALAPNPPMHGGTDAAILAHYRTYHDGILAGAFVWSLATLALLLFVATVVRAAQRARAAEGRGPGVLPLFTLLAAAAAIGMLLASQAAMAAETALGHHATDTTVIRAVDEMSHMLAHLAMAPLGVLGLAMGLTLADARLGSRTVALAGAALGAALAASASWVFVGAQWLHNAGALCLFGTMLWWVAQSVALLRADRPSPATAALPATAGPVAA